MRKQHTLLTFGFLAIALTSTQSHAEYFTASDPANPGTAAGSYFKPVAAPTGTSASFSEGWEQLTKTAYSLTTYNFPGNGFWPDLESQTGGAAGANVLHKISNGSGGGPYPATGSIYYGGTSSTPNTAGGALAVVASGPGVLTGVKTVVFQIDIGEAWTYDFLSGAAPVLTYTTASGSTTISATFSSHYKEVYNGQVLMEGVMENLNINSYAYQFNLGTVTGITSFSISFEGVQHAQLYGTGLQQFNAATSTNLLPPPK